MHSLNICMYFQDAYSIIVIIITEWREEGDALNVNSMLSSLKFQPGYFHVWCNSHPIRRPPHAVCFIVTKFIPLTFYSTSEWEGIALEPSETPKCSLKRNSERGWTLTNSGEASAEKGSPSGSRTGPLFCSRMEARQMIKTHTAQEREAGRGPARHVTYERSEIQCFTRSFCGELEKKLPKEPENQGRSLASGKWAPRGWAGWGLRLRILGVGDSEESRGACDRAPSRETGKAPGELADDDAVM